MNETRLTLTVLKDKYAVSKTDHDSGVPDWVKASEFFSITHTADEYSIVCCQDMIPGNIKQEKDWRILKIEGPLDFTMIGILSSISGILAFHRISIFAISTYNTDYIMLKENDLEKAVNALQCEGYIILF